MTKKTDDYRTIRIWKKTHYLLNLLAALYQESMVELLSRLVEEELKRAKERGSITNLP